MPGTETVTLRGGILVALPALRLLWDLERRGFHVRRGDDGALLVSPRSRLKAEDDHALRRYRNELLALISVCDSEWTDF